MVSLGTEAVELGTVSTSEFDQYFLVPHLGKIHEAVLVPSAVVLARHPQDAKLEIEPGWWPRRYLLDTWEISVAYAR